MKPYAFPFGILTCCSFSLLFFTGCNTIPVIQTTEAYKNGVSAQREQIDAIFYGSNPAQEEAADGSPKAANAVIASELGFDEADSTRFLQAAFDSGAEYVLVRNMNKPWIAEPLFIKSNTTVYFEEGCELVARRGSFQGTSDALLNLKNMENVTIYGYGASIRMHKEDYRKPPYKKGEWRHTIWLGGSRNVSIYGITASASGGDGIYLGRGKIPYNDSVRIENVVLSDHYRQGISVICAQNLTIKNVEIRGTEGTLPSAGIDFEPNRSDERLVNCTISDCVIESNNGGGILIIIRAHKADSLPFSITVERCRISWSFFSVALWKVKPESRGELRLVDNELCWFLSLPPATPDLRIIKEP